MEFTIEYITEWGGGHGRPWEVDITKEMCAEKGGVHRRPWEVEFKPWSCHVRGDIMRDVRHGIGRAHGRPWEVEVLTLGFVKAMGGGGMVEMVEMVEMYLLNKYTRHPKNMFRRKIKQNLYHISWKVMEL